MKRLVLALKLVAWAYLTYLFVFLLTSYEPAQPAFRPPFGLFVLDTVNLFIHEAGHLFFKFFGMWLHIIAGSLFQVLLPAALLVVTARQRIPGIGWPAFWLGESLINVSVYIKDAPDRKLKLIAKGLIHDWNWLLSGNLEAAEPLAAIVFILGILIAGAGIGLGVYFAFKTYRQDMPAVPLE